VGCCPHTTPTGSLVPHAQGHRDNQWAGAPHTPPTWRTCAPWRAALLNLWGWFGGNSPPGAPVRHGEPAYRN
jgi:hypothetical protein